MRQFDNSYNTYRYIIPLSEEEPDFQIRSRICVLFENLDSKMNTLMIELERIETTYIKLRTSENIGTAGARPFEYRVLFTELWSDYYFFLNTVVRAYKLVMDLYRIMGYKDCAAKIRNSRDYKDAVTIRNGFEHFESRIRKYGQDYDKQIGTMHGNGITVEGVSFSADESSLMLLCQSYDDISDVILEKYIKPNKERVDEILSRIGRIHFPGEIHLDKVKKVVPSASNAGDDQGQ